MRTRTMKPLFLIFCLCLSPLLMGQNQNKIQEAMANYDYETAVELINKEPPTIPLLMQKAKALKGIGSNAEALRSIRQVIAEDSTNQQAHIETSMPVCNSSTCFATPKTMLKLLEKVQ